MARERKMSLLNEFLKNTSSFAYAKTLALTPKGVVNIKNNYIVFQDIENDYYVGVKRKIYNQSEVFDRNGFPSTVHIIDGKKLKDKIKNFKNEFRKKNNEIFIFRYFGVRLFSLFNYIRKKSKNNILILEIPTPLQIWEKEIKFAYKNKFKIRLLIIINRLIARRIFNYFDIIIEYAPEAKVYLDKYKKKVVYISNGIDMSTIPINEYYKGVSNNIKFISVASISVWHGYDRILKGMYEYYQNNPERLITYNCVGDGPELSNLRKLSKELSLENYVVFHGKKTGDELDKLFDESHVAFGSLAIHRKGTDIASELKNREYCARGIPFVIACRDKGFPEDFKYSMKVSQDERSINVNEVIDFYDSIKNSNYTTEMRKYAEENLTWDINLKPVFEKINKSAKFRHND